MKILEPHQTFAWPGGLRSVGEVFDFLSDAELSATTIWTVNKTGTPTLPTAVTDALGGIIAVTTGESDNDRIEVTRKAEIFKLSLGKTLHFMARVKFSDATLADYAFGLGVKDGDFLGDTAVMPDGVFFEKNSGDTNLDFVIARDAAAVADYQRITTGLGGGTPLFQADTEWHVFELKVQMSTTVAGSGRVQLFADNHRIHDGFYTGLPYDEEIGLLFGVQNGEAAAKTLSLDYIGAVQNR